MKPIFISSGEPAGIGPDLCLSLAGYDVPLIVAADPDLMHQRAVSLGLNLEFEIVDTAQAFVRKKNVLNLLPFYCNEKVCPGKLNKNNAQYVLDMLSSGIDGCLNGTYSAIVTAPVHKGIINEAGFSFTGHTEFLAQRCNADAVVMMLANETMRMALVTTHLPLSQVSAAIHKDLIISVITTLNEALKTKFNISFPKMKVAGLNPHAGESGHLGREEIEHIEPALNELRQQGMNIEGPLSADTMFIKSCDAYVVMYHDQGLPVLKYSGFSKSVNITLGLPIIRTSVDHGTALDKAGSNQVDSGSMRYAISEALKMVNNSENINASKN